MNAKHLTEEIQEAHVPHWKVLIKDDQGFYFEVGSIDFKTTSDRGGLVILSASPSAKEETTS